MPWPIRARAHPPQPSSSAKPARIPHRRDESEGCAASSSAQNNGTVNYASSSTSDPSSIMPRVPFSPSSYQHPRIAAPERIPGCASAPATPRTPRMYLPGPDVPSPATLSSRPHERLSMPVAFAQAKLVALPVVDMEADRLARACGLSPTSIHWSEPSSSRGSGRTNKAASHDAETDASTPSDPSGSSGWGARPRARSVRIPQRTLPSQGPPSRPRSASQPASIPVFSPFTPRPVLRSLRDILDQEGVQLDGCLDVQHVVERWRRAATAERGLEHEGRSQGLGAAELKTFGAPVSVAVKCGSMATVMGGFQHRIPWVVFACVEELNRTGIYQPGLFRAVPHRNRLSQLVQSFDLPLPTSPPAIFSPDEPMCPLVTPCPSITRSSLRTESMADICALLKSYLTELPEPLLDENLTVALYQLCVHPSIVRERLESESTFPPSNDMIDGEYFAPHGVHTPIPSHHRTNSAPPFSLPAALLTPSERRSAELTAESAQILIAQHLLRLAPPPLCSLFSYLFGFFTQLPLSPDNGLTLEDVSRMFGRVLAGDSTVSRRHSVLMWLLERWTRVSEGLFDIAASKEGDEDEVESTPQAPFALFSPPVPPMFELSTENLVAASNLYRPHSASTSSCQSDGAASVASASTGESVVTPGTEPTSLFAVAEAEPHWETDEPWVPYSSSRDHVGDVHMAELDERADGAHSAGSIYASHIKDGSGGSTASTYAVSPPESEYASCACSRSGSVSRDSSWDSHHHFRHLHSGTSSRSWPVSPRLKGGSVGAFPPDAFASDPGPGAWEFLCSNSDVTPTQHSR